MPQTPQPINGPLGPVWTPLLQAAHAQKQKSAALAAQAQQGNLYDQWTNCVEVSGSNLLQNVIIGAAFQQGGVEVSTGFANGTAGRAVQQNTATGTITLSASSKNATLSPASGSVFAVGMSIGAVDADGNNAITPGTTITAVSGSTLTLSDYPAESGTALYCAACNFVQAEAGPWTALTLTSQWGVPSGYYSPAVRLASGDTAEFRGTIKNTSGSGYFGTVASLPSAINPQAQTLLAGSQCGVTPGSPAYLSTVSTVAANGLVGLDGLRFSLF